MNEKKRNNLLIDMSLLLTKLNNREKIEIIGRLLQDKLTTISLIDKKTDYDILDSIEFMEKYKKLMDELVSGKIREKSND